MMIFYRQTKCVRWLISKNKGNDYILSTHYLLGIEQQKVLCDYLLLSQLFTRLPQQCTDDLLSRTSLVVVYQALLHG